MSIPTISDIAGIIAAPELKFTNSGKAILNLRLAFNDSKYDEQQGKWVNSKTFYVDAQVWEDKAERLAQQLQQGDQVYVQGRIETQSWEKDGEKKSKPVLNLNTARKLEKGNGGQQNPQTQGLGYAASNQQPSQGAQNVANQLGGQAQQGWGAPAQQPAWGTPAADTNEPPF